MPNLNPNSTNYIHSFEPNTNDLTMAMDYTVDGEPALRVLSNIQGDISIEGDVTIPGAVKVENVSGTSLAINDNDGSLTVDGSVSVSNFPATYPITDNGGSITVDGSVSATISGTVALDANTLAALETTTVNQGTTPWVVSGNVSIGEAEISLAGVETTSKNRLKISEQEIVLFSNALYSTDPEVWDRAVYNNATVTYDQLQGGTILTATSDVDSEAIVQSVRVMPYVPGRGVEVAFAIQYNDSRPGVRRRVGVFDEDNCMYFEQDETGEYYVVIRSNTTGAVVNTRVARDNWNGVKFDGTEPNGITADPDAIQMFVIEYDWYGAGQVRFNYIINGYKYTVHTFSHANILTTTYMRTPNLPVRFEIKNITGAIGPFELRKWGVSVIQEGNGGKNLGRPGDIINAIGGTSLGQGGTYRPVVAIRLKSTRLGGVVTPNLYQAVTTSNALLNSCTRI